MHFTTLAATCAAFVLAADAVAQRGMGGRFRRAEEITNRVGAFFADVSGPETDGDKVADLDTCELVRAAVAANQLTVLYLVDQQDNEEVRQQFEFQLFRSDELGIELRHFHCGRIDLGASPALAERFGKEAPLFVVFDAKGKAIEVPMTGYKPSATSLTKALERAAAGTVKPSLATFAKKYGGIVQDLERLLQKREQVDQQKARADNEGKKQKLDKELEQLAAEEKKLLEAEQKLIGEARLPERPTGARHLGERPFRGRGEGNQGRGEGGGGGRRGGG